MQEFLAASLSYPTVIFSALMIAMLLYWTLVIVGAVGLDLLGGHDHALELDGHHLDAVDAAEAPSAFRLRQVPVTVVISLLTFYNWLFCHLGSHYLIPHVNFLNSGIAGTVLLFLSLIAGFVLTKLSVVPLAPLFHTHQATRRKELVGEIVTVRTGRVDRKYGQAVLDDDEHALLLEVRCDPASSLQRGQRVMIISVDDETGAFDVEPVEDLLGESPRKQLER
ncbi:MAG: NfeD family protein [Myxococcales bacterium]|nr:NfeD family protein [Myxococcales bacterium]